MLFLRSLAFNLFFYVHTIVWLFVLLPTEVLPRIWLIRGVRLWAKFNRLALQAITGIRVELRGLENRPAGGAIYASKHQSTFETVSLLDLFSDPTFVLKKELMSIPLFGWYAKKAEQIPIDRSAGRTAMQSMAKRAREEMARGRQLVIYPEGTRRAAGAPPSYKQGVSHLYRDLGVPLVPVALNSGLFWPRRHYIRRPGTVVIEFGEVIPAGLEREEFRAEMIRQIESISDRLLAEAGGTAASTGHQGGDGI